MVRSKRYGVDGIKNYYQIKKPFRNSNFPNENLFKELLNEMRKKSLFSMKEKIASKSI